MSEVRETLLPGVGVRYEFDSSSGECIGVIVHQGGRREVVVYNQNDPDVCSGVLHLSADDARTMSELLGGTRISEVTTVVQQEIEGLTIDWIPIHPQSPYDGLPLADTQIRTRTGVSIVAVVRNAATFPSPDPTFQFHAGDTVVAVGTPASIDAVRTILGAQH